MDCHLKDCPALISQGCPFIGCNYKSNDVSVETLQKHLQDSIIFHSCLQTKAQKHLQKQLISLERKQQSLILEREEKENEVMILKKQIIELQKAA